MSAKRALLAADIGGTKTALALIGRDGGARRPLVQATYPSQSFPSLEAIVCTFLADKDVRVERGSFGVAGPVVNNQAHITNLPWMVDGDVLSQALGGAPVHLLNDLESLAYAVPYLQPSDIETLNAGQAVERGALAVIAPGTGLGEAFLVWSNGRYVPQPSEGGHSSFAPSGKTQRDLLAYLADRLGHVSNERVCAGPGIPNIYAFLRDSGSAEPAWLRAELAAATDQTPVIVQAALAGRAEICKQTLDLFVAILGSRAGSLALTVLATGGVYVGGGVPPRIISALRQPTFMQAFTSKGRLSDLLRRMPVHVILRSDGGLFGAACHALEQPALP
jgi:glucokinase